MGRQISKVLELQRSYIVISGSSRSGDVNLTDLAYTYKLYPSSFADASLYELGSWFGIGTMAASLLGSENSTILISPHRNVCPHTAG